MNLKLKKARIQLLISHPFFASILLPLPEREIQGLGAVMATNGVELFYDPQLVEELEVEELTAVYAHEALHIALLHPLRRGHRDPQLWNKACDYAINPLLQHEFRLPRNALLEPAFAGKYAEEIYDIIAPPPVPPSQNQGQDQADETGQQEQPSGRGRSQNTQGQNQPQPQSAGTDQNNQTQPQGQSGTFQAQDPSRWGAVLDVPENISPQQLEAEIKQLVAQALQAAKQAGRIPAGLERLVEDILQPKLPWREILRRFLTDCLKTDYTWLRPSRRHLWAGLYLPSMGEPGIDEIVVAVDTSGSISQQELDQFAAEITAIAQENVKRVTVIYCDCEVQGVQTFEPHEPVRLTPKGGGGTSFRPVFEYVEKHGLRPAVLVYLTDLECYEYPEQVPPYPVIWVTTQEHRKPPFGHVVSVKA